VCTPGDMFMCPSLCCVVLQVTVDVPDQKGRLDILKVHARNKKLDSEVDLQEVALRTPGGFLAGNGGKAVNHPQHEVFWGRSACMYLMALLVGKGLSSVCMTVSCTCTVMLHPTHYMGVPAACCGMCVVNVLPHTLHGCSCCLLWYLCGERLAPHLHGCSCCLLWYVCGERLAPHITWVFLLLSVVCVW